ncbi:MAG: type II toxin-antitoxin system Phd/YefM family antitoxin [Actinobacteria bacterium]|nr:type II toxin-antitoxin system Phd/YefM family antitoxin [Actinomycetota bacterium]
MVITASEVRAQLLPLIEQVNNDSSPVVITSKKGNAVLVSETEWESMVETMYLLRTKTNSERLGRSLEEAQTGDLYEYVLPMSKTSQRTKVSTHVKKVVQATSASPAKRKVAATVLRETGRKHQRDDQAGIAQKDKNDGDSY